MSRNAHPFGGSSLRGSTDSSQLRGARLDLAAFGDRNTVASALVATATARAQVSGVLHFNRSHLGERVDARVNPRRRHPYMVGCALVVVWVAVGATPLSNSVQLHHLASCAEHVWTTHG